MIEQLTKSQQACLTEFTRKWTDIGLCTAPADRHEAERGVAEAYKIVGLEAPKIVWCGSPLGQGLTRAMQSVRQSVVNSVRQSVVNSVRQSVRPSVRQSVSQSVSQSVWQSVSQSVSQ